MAEALEGLVTLDAARVVTPDEPILAVSDLRTYFFTKRGVGKAVDGVSFELHRGETLGLIGESGSGKSITALSILGLHPRPAARIVSGRIMFRGEDLLKKSQHELTRYRGRHIALILQDPMTALDPVFTVGDQLEEPLRQHQGLAGTRLKARAIELLQRLHIAAAEKRIYSYPHQLSGGMRQRVVGAMAISCTPEVIVADEPTTSLDATVQASYLAHLKEIQADTQLAILFITHDFSVVAKMCDRVAVMYAGKIIETGPTAEIFEKPAHPYTEALLNSVPDITKGRKRLTAIDGAPPSIFDLPTGCSFAARCRYVQPKNELEFPPQVRLSSVRTVACWRHV